MSNFLTDARTALLDELKDDTEIASRVKTWFDFGPGLARRFNVEPAACPMLALSPEDGEAARTSNALVDVVQRLRIEAATDGQDAEPCEELVALILECIKACDESCLGLGADGLAAVEVEGVSWRPVPAPTGARLIWTARIVVALMWKRS